MLVLLGLSSVSYSISLGNTLYYEYGWYTALLLAGAGVALSLRRRRVCTLRAAGAQWRLFLSVITAMAVAYAARYWVTSYLARAAS